MTAKKKIALQVSTAAHRARSKPDNDGQPINYHKLPRTTPLWGQKWQFEGYVHWPILL